jgi:hypothetical protein
MTLPIHPPNPEYPFIIDMILAGIQGILRQKLVGLYLYGSLVAGDYDDDVSDVDLLAALTEDLSEDEFNALDNLHRVVVLKYPRFEHRIEIAYYALRGLKHFKTESNPIGIISPGEPFHIIQAGKDWLLNWYVVREKSQTLYGPPPQTIIEPTTRAEYVQMVKEHALKWRDHVGEAHTRPGQAYAILTLCRALYTITYGEKPSKKQAAEWAMQQMPEWDELIQNALAWRKAWRTAVPDPDATLPETKRFVHAVIDRILAQ